MAVVVGESVSIGDWAMARRFFFGSLLDDVFTGSNLSEFYFTGRGDDRVDAGGGNDLAFSAGVAMTS